jgi:mRNA-degrading endonuclease HigB of HigAB toxin-antitoxin module
VELAQVLGRWLGVRRVMLTDAAIVGCPSAELYDLSLFVLAKYGVTWYMRMGFRPCVHPSVRCDARQLERKHLRVLERAVASVRTLTSADVTRDARAIVQAIKSTPTETALENIQFDEFTLWQRSKIVREDAALYSTEKLRILVGVHTQLQKVVESVPDSSEPFMEWFVRLQKSDCGTFHDIYQALFDNDVYYWRSRRCMYHITVNDKRLVFRLAAGMQLVSAVLDPTQSGELWFEKTIPA